LASSLVDARAPPPSLSAAMASESQEIEELKGMLSNPTGSMRESPITYSKFAKFMVGEERREAGAAMRSEIESWKKQKQSQLNAHKTYGLKLKSGMKEQNAQNAAVKNSLVEANLAQGKAIKAEVSALKQAKSMAKAQHEFHGRQLAKVDMEQRERIKQVRGEGSVTLNALTAKVKAEELELAEKIEEKKKEIAIANRAEVLEIKKMTADHVTDASKKAFYEQRKSIAENTRQAEAAWMSEREQKKAEFIAKAKATKAELAVAKERAKASKEQTIIARQQIAAKARKEQEEIKETLEKIAVMSASGVKGTHDRLYRQKFVPATEAEKLTSSPYASTVA